MSLKSLLMNLLYATNAHGVVYGCNTITIKPYVIR